MKGWVFILRIYLRIKIKLVFFLQQPSTHSKTISHQHFSIIWSSTCGRAVTKKLLLYLTLSHRGKHQLWLGLIKRFLNSKPRTQASLHELTLEHSCTHTHTHSHTLTHARALTLTLTLTPNSKRNLLTLKCTQSKASAWKDLQVWGISPEKCTFTGSEISLNRKWQRPGPDSIRNIS